MALPDLLSTNWDELKAQLKGIGNTYLPPGQTPFEAAQNVTGAQQQTTSPVQTAVKQSALPGPIAPQPVSPYANLPALDLSGIQGRDPLAAAQEGLLDIGSAPPLTGAPVDVLSDDVETPDYIKEGLAQEPTLAQAYLHGLRSGVYGELPGFVSEEDMWRVAQEAVRQGVTPDQVKGPAFGGLLTPLPALESVASAAGDVGEFVGENVPFGLGNPALMAANLIPGASEFRGDVLGAVTEAAVPTTPLEIALSGLGGLAKGTGLLSNVLGRGTQTIPRYLATELAANAGANLAAENLPAVEVGGVNVTPFIGGALGGNLAARGGIDNATRASLTEGGDDLVVDLSTARTGQPISLTGFRGDSDKWIAQGAGTPDRGQFFTTRLDVAEGYAGPKQTFPTETWPPGARITREELNFKNPLVIDASMTRDISGQEAAAQLLGIPKETRSAFEIEPQIAAAARRRGHDGIIYVKAEEIQDLRAVPVPGSAADLPPPRAPEVPVQQGAPNPARALDNVIPNSETSVDAAVRNYEGLVETAARQERINLDTGTANLRNAGFEPGRQTPEVEGLYKALHGEADIPADPRARAVYDDLQRLLAEETAATVDFDPNFRLHPDYFPRFWEAPKTTRAGVGSLGGRPAFTKPRVDATFQELLDAGWTPKTWNPYEMVALRRMQGAEYRAQQSLLNILRENGLIADATGPRPEGWRVPDVGGAVFQPKPYVDKTGAIHYTSSKMVPDDVANVLEQMFGRRVNWGTAGPLDIHDALSTTFNVPKRIKLLASLFQQIDFLTRTGAASVGGALNDLLSGKPFSAAVKAAKIPANIGELFIANLSPGRRRALRSLLNSTSSVSPQRPGVTWRMISEEGLVSGDWTAFNKTMRDSISQIAGEATAGRPRQVLNSINGAMERGLFEGVYPQAQKTAIENFIGPAIIRAHPDWSDRQIAASIAVEASKMFSSIPRSQSALRHLNRNVSELARMLVFSTNEPEALIKSAVSTVAGPNKALWGQYWAGAYIFLGALANTIHYATTGEPLPLDRYSPVTTEGQGPLPVGYSTNFMAPDIPIEGRGGTNLTLDLVGQLDTALRLLDPGAFIQNRENVITRALHNQIEGSDYFGRPIDSLSERLGQLFSDVGLPIPAQQLSGILIKRFPALENWIADQEGRVGETGSIIQALGGNLRAETNAELRDRMALESGLTNQGGQAITKWDDLDPLQKQDILGRPQNQEYVQELARRRDEAVVNQADYAIAGESRERILEGIQAEIDQREGAFADQAGLEKPLPEYWREASLARLYSRLQYESDFAAQLEGYEKDDLGRVLDDYYAIGKLPDGTDDPFFENPDGSPNLDLIFEFREAYQQSLSSEPGPNGETSDFLLLQAYLDSIDAKKTIYERAYDDLWKTARERGYNEVADDDEARAAFWEQNPDLEAELAYWKSGVEGADPPAMENDMAVTNFLLLNAKYGTNYPVKLAGFDYQINASEESLIAYQELYPEVAESEYFSIESSKRQTWLRQEANARANAILVYLGWGDKLHSIAAQAEYAKLVDLYGGGNQSAGLSANVK